MAVGKCLSPSMTSALLGALEIESSESTRAIIVSTTIWLVYAFVEATPISQPALMCTPHSVARETALPTVFVTPMHSAPRFSA